VAITQANRLADGPEPAICCRTFEPIAEANTVVEVGGLTNLGGIALLELAGSFVRSGKSRVDAAIVGMADRGWLIERISSDAETLFGFSVGALIGRPLISLVAEHDVPSCLVAMEEAATSQHGVSLFLDLRAVGVGEPAGLAPLGCEVLVLPLKPSPSFAFVFLPSSGSMSRAHVATDLGAMLVRMGRGAEVAELARRLPNVLTGRTLSGLNKLTTRELDLLTRLLQGDRVPAIALELFVTQSTVRSHLASIFQKVGVTSQQQLLDLFRGPRPVQRQATVTR
jgi:DNA-binding CsgD family transcriptional regulator